MSLPVEARPYEPPADPLDGPSEPLAPLVEVPLEDEEPDGRLMVVPQDEVVRLDLSELADDEAETILDVLGKDSVFRAEEKGRIDKIEAEVHEESERQRSQERRHRDAQRACARCGQTFRLLFNKRLVCQLCSASVCRRCATYEAGRRGWICSACQRERELQANKWLSEIQLRHRVSIRTPGCRLSDSEDDSGYDPSVTHDEPPRQHAPSGPAAGEEVTPAGPVDPDRLTTEVRGHLENVVETLLGESIQNASIRPAAADAALYREYQPKLVAAIERLTQSLYMTLQNRPPDEAHSPTTTLAELKTVLQQAEEASMRLPLGEDVDNGQVPPVEARDSLTSPDGCGEEPNSHTYEEILATAVLSRLGEKARRAAAASFCDAAVQSDDVTPLQCEVIRPLQSAGPAADDRLVGQSAGTDGEGPLGDGAGGVLEITIEEEIEEIVTYDDGEETGSGGGTAAETETETETEGDEGSRRGSLASQASTLRSVSDANSGDDVSLPGPSISYSDLNFSGGQTVPFPELGRSLPEVSPLEEVDEEEAPGDRTSWEENWLFRRRRLTQPNRLLGDEPVPMLVPHPSQPTAVTVGSRDVDELSDLSERGSESSLDDWTAGGSLSPAPAQQDVTTRLKAARDADRDRYLTATGRLNSSPRRGSAGSETPGRPAGERRSSADSASLPSVTRSVQPAPAAAAAAAAGTSTPESSLSRAISWSSVPSDVDLAFSAVSERLAAGSPPPPPPADPRLAAAASAAGPTTGQAGTASSAAKRPISAAARTVPGSSSSPAAVTQRTDGTAAEVVRPGEAARQAGSGAAEQRSARPVGVVQQEGRRMAVPAGVGAELMAQAGNIAQFRCRVPVTENSETLWLRDGVVLEPGERHEMYRVRDQHHLLVYGVTRRDAGRFSCLVVTADGTETWHHFTLRVLGSARPPQQPRFSVAPESQLQPVSGAALRLVVRVTGHPEPRVTFLQDDRPLRRSDTVRIERHSGGEWVLAVQPVRPSDSGQYSVQAANSAGSVSREFGVDVQPQPEVSVPALPPLSPPPARHPVRQRPARPVPAAVSVSPVTSPPSYVTSRDEALKETSLTEACNSVILRARPARVRSPADGGRDSESDGDGDGDGEEICLPLPPPGTIAEREHRKWENAVAMPNNPYTLERVRQRRRSRPLDRTGYYSAAHYSSGEDVSDHDLVSTDPSNKIDCGLKSINSERYRRDYYINAGARSRWSSLPANGRRQGAGGSGCGSSRPVSALSEEPLPPLSVRGSSDDLRSAGAGSVYHSSESLAVTERVSSVSPSAPSPSVASGGGGGGSAERRPSTRSSTASPAVGEDELPPEGTVRSAVEKMQQLSRSAEELPTRRPRLTPTGDTADGRSTLSASPSVPVVPTPTPPPPAHTEAPAEEPQEEHHEQEQEQEEVRRSPLYVQVEEDGAPPAAEEEEEEEGEGEERHSNGLEQRPSPDGRESLASSGGSDLPPQLPSVKELRSHFQAGGAPPPPQKQESPLYNSSVLIIDKADQESEAWDEPRELRKVEKLRKKTSSHKVHSLTARSVSREFREGLKLGAPLSLHAGNIRDPGLLCGQRAVPATDCAGQQRQQQQQQQQPEEGQEEGQLGMAPGLRLVASRAAFWDRKVTQELS